MLIFIVVLIIAAAVLEKLSLDDPLKYVRYDISSSKRSVDPDEEFFVVSTVENTRRLPLPYIEVAEKLPDCIRLDTTTAKFTYKELHDTVSSTGILTLSSRIYLMPKQKLTRRVSACIDKRGRYFFRGATMSAGDFLGFTQTVCRYTNTSEIVVLPRRAQDECVTRPLGGFLGDMSVRRFIMEDPVLLLGFSEYTGQEPQKSIAWKQSARLNKLMVKRFDHTLEPSVTVVLNVDCGATFADTDACDRIEECFSIARTVCETLEAMRIKYSFITNATAAGAFGLWSTITDGLGANHLLTILEGLGRATYEPTEHFSHTVERAALCAEHGRSHVLITPEKTPTAVTLGKRLFTITGGDVLTLYADEVTTKAAIGEV